MTNRSVAMKFEVGRDGIATYTTLDGDTVDLVAFNYYGDHELTSEQVLAFNPGLAERGPVYPAGVKMRMPPRKKAPKTVAQIEVWN